MTITYALQVGLVVRRGNRTLEFDRRLDSNTVLFIDCMDKRPHQWSICDLQKDINSGKLVVVTAAQSTPPLTRVEGITTIFDVDSIPEKHKKQVDRCLEYVKAFRRRGLTRGMRARVTKALPEVAQQLGDSSPPSVSTILLMWRKLERSDNNSAALVSGHVQRRASTRKVWQLAIVKRAIRTEYCNRDRISIKTLHDSVNRQLRAASLRNDQPIEEAKISYTTLRREINLIDKFALDSSRYSVSYAKNKWRSSFHGVGAIRALQRYEIDHTVIDVVVISDVNGMPLGRPTITVIVDAYSAYVVGFFVSFWGPGLASTFSALKVAFAPKDTYQLSSWNIENPWLGMGVCELLVMDNGMEFHSPQVRSLARRLDMDLLYNPVRQPWLKPVVEQTFRKLGHQLPVEGRVEKQLNNYLPRSADHTSAITFSALCQGLTMAFVDVHANSINERKLARPIDLFGESLEELPPPLLLGPTHDLEITMGEQGTKVIGNEGVIQDYIRYNTPDLQQLRGQFGHKFKTEIRYQPDNLDHIYVRVPETAHWLLVPSCCPEYTHNLSAVQHKAIRRFAKDELTRRNAEETLMRAKCNLRDHWNASVRFGKRLKKNHLKALSGLTSAHILADGPISAAQATTPMSTVVPVCEADLLPPLHELPTFEAISFRRGS